MKETFRLIVVPTIFGIAAGFFLSWTNSATQGPIETSRKAEMMAALHQVLPECDNDIVADAKAFKDEQGKEWTFYVARLKGAYVGAAFCSTSEHGYGGPIKILVGVLRDSTISGLEILQADGETPGLGSRIKAPEFRDQFKEKSASDTRWAAVTKAGGKVNAITGATISSRAVIEAVKAGLEVYARHSAEIASAEK